MKFSAPLALVAFVAGLLLSGCASRKLPRFEKPVARTEFQSVRTTAYTHSEADHRRYGKRSAIGSTLSSGAIKSASADWSRWPAGTVFRLLDTGETYEVDDYGWALSGTNTIDLYKPTRSDMNTWGVRRVNIQVLRWGEDRQSYSILAPRAKHRHVRRMLDQLRRNGRV